MFSRLRMIILGLIFTAYFFIPIVFALDLNLPLPPGAVKISEKNYEFGLKKSLMKRYESSWDKNKLILFYKKEFKKLGWMDKGNEIFIKDDNMVALQVNPKKNVKGRTGFIVAVSKMITADGVLAMHKKNPDKLKFMPVYPGSEQLFLQDLPSGVAGIYKVTGTAKEAGFFYKAGMLNYGWSLSSEKSVNDKTKLMFHKGESETCEIVLADNSVTKGETPSLNITTISITYHVQEKIRIKR